MDDLAASIKVELHLHTPNVGLLHRALAASSSLKEKLISKRLTAPPETPSTVTVDSKLPELDLVSSGVVYPVHSAVKFTATVLAKGRDSVISIGSLTINVDLTPSAGVSNGNRWSSIFGYGVIAHLVENLVDVFVLIPVPGFSLVKADAAELGGLVELRLEVSQDADGDLTARIAIELPPVIVEGLNARNRRKTNDHSGENQKKKLLVAHGLRKRFV